MRNIDRVPLQQCRYCSITSTHGGFRAQCQVYERYSEYSSSLDIGPLSPPPARIDRFTQALHKSYENILELTEAERNADHPLDVAAGVHQDDRRRIPNYGFNQTALTNYQIQQETANIVKAAEEILMLTRQMQELWLGGGLDVLGKERGKAEEVEQLGQGVTELVQKLVRQQDVGEREEEKL